MSLKIEAGGEKTALCDWCYQPYKAVRGFVYKEENAHAVYFAALHDCRSAERIAHLAIVLGDWDEQGEAREVFSIGVEARQRADTIDLDIVEPQFSPWRGAKHLGVMLQREAFFKNARRAEFMRVAECVVEQDAAVNGYLDS
jgi:hypothetical protein